MFVVYSGKGGLGSLASSQSVSFRPGSNVELGTPEDGPAGAGGARRGRDFSNPVYDAVTPAPAPAPAPLYETPDAPAPSKPVDRPAVLPASTQESRPRRPRALDPAADTGKDTAQLVLEDRSC